MHAKVSGALALSVILFCTGCVTTQPKRADWPPPGYRVVAETMATKINPEGFGIKSWNAGFGRNYHKTGILAKIGEPMVNTGTKRDEVYAVRENGRVFLRGGGYKYDR